MTTPAEQVDAIIANATVLADEHLVKMEQYLSFGVDIATGGTPTVINPYNWQAVMEAIEPPVPTADTPTDLYESYRDELLATMSGLLADFYANYFPIVNDAYDDATAWLINTITNGGTGIPAAIEDQIWQRARTRVIKEGSRAESQLTSGFAAKGFSLPNGVMNRDIKEIRHNQRAILGEQSTDIAVKQVEIEIENIKFAVGKALDMRIAGIGAANDYIRAMTLAPELAIKLTETDSSVQARLMSATADMYRARLTRDQLVMNTEIAKMSNFQTDQTAFWNAFLSRKDSATDSVIEAAQGYSKTAQAALASLNSVASIASSSFE